MRQTSGVLLKSWGRSFSSVSRRWDAESEADVSEALRGAGGRGIIARGFARSYGDVCLNNGGDVVDVTRLTGIHDVDVEGSAVTCGAGVTYAELMRMLLPLGLCPPACPGTAVVSMGGAIANDVHGKNQEHAGNFGDHVEWLDLLLPGGERRRISSAGDPELFAATIGGIGLTGVILQMRLRLMRVQSNAMHVQERRVPDLDSFLELLAEPHEECPYVVGWIDALSRGRNLGRGILERARHSERGVRAPAPLFVSLPVQLPEFVLNPRTVLAFNTAYFHRVPRGGRERTIHANRFLYPLDAVHNWNRMYGSRGVLQFQCIIPFREGRRGIVELMEAATRSAGASFLAVIKSMGRAGQGMLSFPMAGFTLAMDFPRRGATVELVRRLYDITLKYEGRAYLAKDACMTAEQMRSMYPRLDEFTAVLRRVDPGGRMQSDMSRRLRLNSGEAV